MEELESLTPKPSKYVESWFSYFLMHRPDTIKSNITKGTLALFGNMILVMFVIAFFTCLIYKLNVGAKSIKDLKDPKKGPTQFDNVYNNWIQTMIQFLGLDIAGATVSFLASGNIDWWNTFVGSAARNLIFLIFNIFKEYHLQSTALAV